MEISTRQAGPVVVVEITGRLDTISSGDASERLAAIAGTEGGKVLLNLQHLEFLSSAGLRIILRTAKTLRSSGGEMKLCHATGFVSEVLEVSGFSNLLHLCDNEAAALEAF